MEKRRSVSDESHAIARHFFKLRVTDRLAEIIALRRRHAYEMTFDYSIDFSAIDFRKKPALYRIGKGEQGVLLVEPYKSEILPHWRFRTPEVAHVSANRIYQMFLEYKKQEDFVGMDMARKFLQMGYTRSRRYANHKSGRKYLAGSKQLKPLEEDAIKAESAEIFLKKWRKAKDDKEYKLLKEKHLALQATSK